MADYTRKLERRRWVGSLDQFLGTVREARTALTEWSGDPPQLNLTAELTGQTMESRDDPDLDALASRETEDIGSLVIRLGDIGTPYVQLQIRNDGRTPALSVRVSGGDEHRVQGAPGSAGRDAGTRESAAPQILLHAPLDASDRRLDRVDASRGCAAHCSRGRRDIVSDTISAPRATPGGWSDSVR
jgi:hypothetical protein